MIRAQFAAAMLVVSCAVLVLGTQLAWVASGSASRNSFEMFRSAQRLGLDQLTPLRVLWFLLPVLCLGALLMLAISRRGLAAAFGVAASLIAATVASIVLASGLASGAGAPVALAGAFAGAGSAALVFFEGRSPRR